MPVTTLDPTAALIVVDLQAGSALAPSAHSFDGVVSNAASLARVFRSHDRPVVLVNVAGVAPGRTEQPIDTDGFPDGWETLVPELGEQPGDLRVTKHTWDAFEGTDLAEQLDDLGVTHVVIAGHATGFGVESTARHAHARGLHVTLATDAMTDPNPVAHDNAVHNVFPRLGETGATEEIIALLERG